MNFSRNAQQGFRGVELFGTPFLSAAAYLSAVPGQQRVALEVYFFHPACYSRIAVPFVFSECLQKNRVDWNDVVHAGSLKGIYSREWGHDSSSISSALSKKKKSKGNTFLFSVWKVSFELKWGTSRVRWRDTAHSSCQWLWFSIPIRFCFVLLAIRYVLSFSQQKMFAAYRMQRHFPSTN